MRRESYGRDSRNVLHIILLCWVFPESSFRPRPFAPMNPSTYDTVQIVFAHELGEGGQGGRSSLFDCCIVRRRELNQPSQASYRKKYNISGGPSCSANVWSELIFLHSHYGSLEGVNSLIRGRREKLLKRQIRHGWERRANLACMDASWTSTKSSLSSPLGACTYDVCTGRQGRGSTKTRCSNEVGWIL